MEEEEEEEALWDVETKEKKNEKEQKKKGKHDELKPCDKDPHIDHWKIEKFDPPWNEGGMLEAIKILDEMYCDITKIGNLVCNKERFVKWRQHLVGPNSSDFGGTGNLTGCYILVQGNTIAAMGQCRELKKVRRIVEECIQNKMHPVYHIKLETGEYFLSEQKKQADKWQEKQEKQGEKTAENRRKRDAAFIPPEEPLKQDAGKSKDNQNLAGMTASLKRRAKEFGKQKSAENVNAEDYAAASGELHRKEKSRRT